MLALAAAVVVVAVLVTGGSNGERTPPEPPPPLPRSSPDLLRVRVDIRQTDGARRLPASFLGFSAEVPYATRITGTPGQSPNRAADGLYAALRATGSGAPVLRVGGSSAEQASWTPRERSRRPPGIRFDVTQAYLDQLRRFGQVNGSPLVLNLNLANRDAATAVGYAVAARRTLGRRVRAYELGNEPDAYAGATAATGTAGRPATLRPAGYSFTDFLGEWSKRARQLQARAGDIPLAGPSVCCAPAFTSRLTEFARRERARLSLLSLHEYFGSACPGVERAAPAYPARDKLLGEAEMSRIVEGFQGAVAIGRRVGRPVAVTETNSFACGGQPGVSDTFASALWAPEYLMRSAAAGITGMYFHTFGRAYSPFDFTYTAGGAWSADVRPLYYGLLLFARATAHRAALLPPSAATQRVRAGSRVVAFPTLDRRGTLRILVLAKGGRRGGRVRVAVPGGGVRAQLTRLEAPGLGARGGVTLAGQSVPAGSRTGRLEGRPAAAGVRRTAGGYRFAMPAAGAALLELRVRP